MFKSRTNFNHFDEKSVSERKKFFKKKKLLNKIFQDEWILTNFCPQEIKRF